MAPRPSGPRDLALLGERLEALRKDWSARRLDSDPLAFAHGFTDPGDREVVAFLAASLAFGRVASIQASVARVLDAMGPRPAVFLEKWDEKGISALRAFRHRWVSGKDVEDFLRMVKRARHAHGSLGGLFAEGDAVGEKTGDFVEGESRRPGSRSDFPDYVAALSTFLRNLRALSPSEKGASRGLAFLLPEPLGGSACKRQNLFLRWMVRTEGFDLGLWKGGCFTPARLLLPMDTHVHRIATYLGLTRRKSADLAAAREATGWLRALNPGDPVAYDWALSRLGILAECVTERTRRHCERCAVRLVCRASLLPVQRAAAA